MAKDECASNQSIVSKLRMGSAALRRPRFEKGFYANCHRPVWRGEHPIANCKRGRGIHNFITPFIKSRLLNFAPFCYNSE
ncbi:hypothetical protein TNCV_1720831 [Trichonephila clavipes]|nr:hypothetical protein TNCV_1720831 [Trichonephila clavipes]